MSSLAHFVSEHRPELAGHFARALCDVPCGARRARTVACARMDALVEGLLRTLQEGHVPEADAPPPPPPRARPGLRAQHAAEQRLRAGLFEFLSGRGCAPSPTELSLACEWLARWTQAGLRRPGAAGAEGRQAAARGGGARLERKLIGIVAHDLRNPLNAVLFGTRAVLSQEGLSPEASRTLARVRASAERAARLVHDLLDVTWARDAGCLPLTPRPLDLHALVGQVVDELRASHPERELRHTAEGDGAGCWDADRLAQLLTNLVCNALDYSPRVSPVEVRTRGDADGVGLEVHNTGAPIPPATLARLHSPLEPGALRPCGGRGHLGLGLFITRLIVQGHGGTLQVRSSAGAGTTCRVHLPRGTP